MPELRCTVQTCVHNQQNYCNLDAICVDGSTAKDSEDTCCKSFEERKDSYFNAADITGQASDRSDIDCKAVECMYNEQCRCHAGKISVEGSNACESEQTECATFHYGNR